MSGTEALDALADLYGIHPRFHDLGGQEHPTSPESKRAVLRANGVDVSSDAAVADALATEIARRSDRRFPDEIVIDSDVQQDLDFGRGSDWALVEEGADAPFAEGRAGDSIILPSMPSGIYDLAVRVQGVTEQVTVLAAPRHLPSLDMLTGCDRLWGLSLALYGLRSDRNSGLGDFKDLAKLAGTLGGLGAGFIGVNPVHAMGFCDFDSISPYSPSHRGFLNTSYIALDHLPGLDASDKARQVMAGFSDDFARFRESPMVQHGPHKRAHQKALAQLYEISRQKTAGRSRQEFAAYLDAATPELRRFAAYEALSETHGADWRTWGREVTPQDAPADRMQFHLWLQWVADRQLQQAQSRALDGGMPLGLYLDLAVGPRRDGAEAWCEQASIAQGVSIGAPPDHLNPEGQRWNLAAFSPAKLKSQKYAPLRQILANTMRHAGVVRIDHVLGLYRSFWIPDDGSPGAYVTQPFRSLLAVIKIEAERNGTAVIGEDLGLVPEGFRETMRDHGFYGYSVLQYEKSDDGRLRDPVNGPSQVLSCFGTHDTPTLMGYDMGHDIDWWQKLGWADPATADHARTRRRHEVAMLRAMGGTDPCGASDPQDEAGRLQNAVHGALAHSPAAMVCIQLDDVLGAVDSQNLPGTVAEHPNWQRKHLASVKDLADHDGLDSLAACMARNGRSACPTQTEEDEHGA